MEIEARLTRGVALALALAAGAAIAAEPPPPGVKRVCVPAEDGRTWECGTSDDPPPQRPLAPRPAPAPPAFLAAPGDAIVTPIEEAPAPEPEPIAQEAADEPPEPVEATAAAEATESTLPEAADPAADAAEGDIAPASGAEAPTADAQSTEAPAPAEPTPTQPSTGGAPPPFLAAPSDPYRSVPLAPASPPAQRQAIVQEPVAEGTVAEQPAAEEPVAEEAVAEEPVVEEPVAEESVAEPPVEAEPVVAAPAESATPAVALPRGESEFLALESVGYTVQLAHAPSRDAFSAALAALGPDAANAYLLPFDRDGVRWWMLVWSQFPDAAAARAAIATVPREAAINVGHPRRVALLQRELRR